ncbi:MAG: CBS domain-containing protein [Microthrixaceae bacterium]
MRVAMILENKGSNVATIAGGATLAEAAGELRLRGVGALVVSIDGISIEGIVSERDIVRRLAERGAQALDEPVSQVMTSEVRTCDPADTCDDLMRVMTEYRMRHLPVVVDGSLSGIVSIGDVVKHRVGELEAEAEALHEYIATGR